MADALLPGEQGGADSLLPRCPACLATDSRVRSIHYAAGKKIEIRECLNCPRRFDWDGEFAISENEARALSGERTVA